MQEATQPTILSEAADPLAAAAYRAEAWAGEPFLRDGEDTAQVLAPGNRTAAGARRRDRRDRGGAPRAELAVEGALRPDARPRARAGRPGAAHGRRDAAPPPPDRRARRDAHRADRGDAARGGAERERQRPRRRRGDRAEIDEDDDDDAAAEGADDGDEPLEEELSAAEDPGAVRRYRFRHPTASGKTIAAAGFVDGARTLGVLILTHRRLLVSQFDRDLTTEGYGDRFTDAIETGTEPLKPNPLTIQTYAWFARHVGSINRDAYQLVICDEAHTALGEKTSAAIRSFPEPVYIGMTATEQLIAKQVSDVFPASVDDLPLQDAARRGLIAPLRCLRVPPVAAINSVPIVGGDFDQEILAKTLDHQALNQAAASLYRDRFDNTPGIVYAAGVDHAYNLAQEFRSAGHQDGGGLRTHAARPARRDARGVRARRDQRADQRAAACRRLELAARDGLHASRADRVEARLPAADRPHHAPPPAQGSRASSSTSSRRARRTTSASSRSTRCSTQTSTAKARASPPPRAAARNAAPAAG